MATSPKEREEVPSCGTDRGKSVKRFRRSQEDVSGASEKAGERTIRFKTSRQKTGCRALRVRATSGASAPERARHETSNPHCL